MYKTNWIETSIEKTAASSFFTPLSQKKPDPVTWRIVNNTLVVGKHSGEAGKPSSTSTEKKKIAAFDLVSCLSGQNGRFSHMGSRADRYRTRP